MAFPKAMRWGDGSMRWVRPVHWLLALHGSSVLEIELFGVAAGARSMGHRFRGPGAVEVRKPDDYEPALERAGVITEPDRRRSIVIEALRGAAGRLGGALLEDPELLEEVVDLVEWPGVVEGRFDPAFLDLPRELLVTTLRHHQKCFSVQAGEGRLLPAFLAVANTDRDPAGHIRRGNEWVVGGRLEDARFFWREDRKRSLAGRSTALEDVVFHAKVGSYADKARRMERLALEMARRLSLEDAAIEHCGAAARLCKNDLVTGTVGEFPELQGQVGGLLLHAEGAPEELARGVYAHYQPLGPEDAIPPTTVGCVVSLADKLDSVAGLVTAGESPTGSRDPFALRRACGGIFRILLEREWPFTLRELNDLASGGESCAGFLLDRLQNHLREGGYSVNEIQAVLRPRVNAMEALDWPLPDVVARLDAIRAVRARPDFAALEEQLADLTKRADNIVAKGSEILASAHERAAGTESFQEDKQAAIRLREMIDRYSGVIDGYAASRDYPAIIDVLARFVDPVEQFFVDVLVLDPDRPEATLHRKELLAQLSGVLTRYIDFRELAGEAERREDRG
jgi:glycyl-tRNA synthetase beta chain